VSKPELSWLPEPTGWSDRIGQIEAAQPSALGQSDDLWGLLGQLARTRLDFLRTERLARQISRLFPDPPSDLIGKPVRLAILGSSTLSHLEGSIRVAGLRRGLYVQTYVCPYDLYLQDLLDAGSALHRFSPTHVLFSFDGRRLAAMDGAGDHLKHGWDLARSAFGCTVLQQTVLEVEPPRLGQNEQRLAGSPAERIDRLNQALRIAADEASVHLIALDRRARKDGVRAWHDPVHWARTKQEVTPHAAPVYGDLVARVLAAEQGRVAKCLVLDLDNTLWGGVIGDDGLDGIVLGQGSAEGEAYLAVQQYAADLADRGVLLAICSKNDEAIARSAFERHPEMHLKLDRISAFVANWDDKATNLRAIAAMLNIGLDSLVFLDDSPFERDLVRRVLPEVMTPEIPDDEPALIPNLIADAGYFEALALTEEDLTRTRQYADNRARAAQTAGTDMTAYLADLAMTLEWRPFDTAGLARIVQLINKTNQFNLTTRRYSAAEVSSVIDDPDAFGLQFRLRDRFGDNGMIAVVIGRLCGSVCTIDTWLMSCRVLGRGVEQASLNCIVDTARRRGADSLIGVYRPTAKNAMVADLFTRLGFLREHQQMDDGATSYRLDLRRYAPFPSTIEVEELSV